MVRRALPLLLALCLVTAGCSALGPDYVREDRAESTLAAANAALAETETYRFEADATVVATSDDESQRVDLRAAGNVSLTERRMGGRTNVSGGGDRYRQSTESYLLNRTRYRECSSRAREWGADESATENWSTLTPAGRQLTLLESGSLLYNGTTTVDGREATLLVGEPTEDALTLYQQRRSESLPDGPGIENARLEAWFDAETDRPIRTTLTFEVSGGDASASTSLTTRYRDYGRPVTVDPPAELLSDPPEFTCPGS